MSEPAHNFKFPQIYNYLLTIKHAEISEEGGYHEISCILREKFSSWKEMEEHQWENVEVSGGGKIIKFNAEMKEMIFHTCSEKDKSIYKEWQKIPRSSHNRTEREKYVVDEHKKIVDKVHKKYLRICVKAFGPICGKCKDKSKSSFFTNCKCEAGICEECLETLIRSKPGHRGSFALCFNNKCQKRINVFTNRSGREHSITTLLGYEEYESDEEEDDNTSHEENENEMSRKRARESYESSNPISSHVSDCQEISRPVSRSSSNVASSSQEMSRPSSSSSSNVASPSQEMSRPSPNSSSNVASPSQEMSRPSPSSRSDRYQIIIEDLKATICQHEATIRQNEATFRQKDATIRQQDATIRQQAATNRLLEAEIMCLRNRSDL